MATKLLEGTDRKTGRPIALYRFTKDDLPHLWYRTTYWVYTDEPWHVIHSRLLNKDTSEYRGLKPKEYCWYDTLEGDPCKVRVKVENQRSGLYACGRHMEKFQADQQRFKMFKENARRREVAIQIAKERFAEYTRAYELLCEAGYKEILGLENPPMMREHSERILRKDVALDLIEAAKVLVPGYRPLDDQSEEVNSNEYEDFVAVDDDFFG